jgi:uncharacterized CHY-type Zn-finger protein
MIVFVGVCDVLLTEDEYCVTDDKKLCSHAFEAEQ